MFFYRPQTKFAKVMFLHVSVILSTGGGSPGPYPGGRLGGHAGGGGSRPISRGGRLRGLQAHTQREVEGSGWVVLQAHTQVGGWGSGYCSTGPGLGGGVSQHALRQTPSPQQTATAADGTHRTGMHSCSY